MLPSVRERASYIYSESRGEVASMMEMPADGIVHYIKPAHVLCRTKDGKVQANLSRSGAAGLQCCHAMPYAGASHSGNT